MGWALAMRAGCSLETLSVVVAVSQPRPELVAAGTLYLWEYCSNPYSAPPKVPASRSGEPSIVLRPSPDAANRRPAALLLRLIEGPPAKKVALYGLRRETGRTIPPQWLPWNEKPDSKFLAGRSNWS
jgi:hypothetical protein